MFLTAWGDALFNSGGSPGLLFVLYSLAHFVDIYLGLACRPADIVLPIWLWSPFRGTPILAGGLASLAFCGVGSFLVLLLIVWAIFIKPLHITLHYSPT